MSGFPASCLDPAVCNVIDSALETARIKSSLETGVPEILPKISLVRVVAFRTCKGTMQRNLFQFHMKYSLETI